MFFFKKKTIVVDTFTYIGSAYELFRIELAKKSIPEWWKKLPTAIETANAYGLSVDRSTMKSCPGITELYKNGIVIPLWSDLILETNSNNEIRYQWAHDQSADIAFHAPVQHGNSFNNHIHFKIQSPWLIKETSGVNWTWLEPTWNILYEHSNIRVLPGVLNFKYQRDTNINIFVPKERQRFELEAGLPLAHLIPLSDKQIEIKHHLISKDEFTRMSNNIGSFKFKNSYRTMLKIKEDQEPKCPFGFK
jgi:hypothetical protein